MTHFLKKFFAPLKKEPIIILFILALLASWVTHINFRDKHFQEVDSAGTYNILYDFPGSTLRFTALMYKEGRFLSETTARKIINDPRIKNIHSAYLSSFTDEFLITQLTKSSLLATFRYGLIQITSMSHLPWPIQNFFSIGFGSTYSPAVGLIYGIFSGRNTSYEDFMSRSMLITIPLSEILSSTRRTCCFP